MINDTVIEVDHPNSALDIKALSLVVFQSDVNSCLIHSKKMEVSTGNGGKSVLENSQKTFEKGWLLVMAITIHVKKDFESRGNLGQILS